MITSPIGNYRVKNPDEQDGLILALPEGSVPTEYINQYSIDYEVRCSLCAKQTPHKNGFTAHFPGLGNALIGKDCGRQHFGKHSANTFEKNIKRKIENANKCERLLRLSTALKELKCVWRNLIEIEKELLALMSLLAQCFLDNDIKRNIVSNSSFTFEDLEDRAITVKDAKCLLSGESRTVQFARAKEFSKRFDGLDTDEKVFEELEQLLEIEKNFKFALSAGIRFLDSSKLFLRNENLKRLNRLAEIYEMGFERIAVRKREDGVLSILLHLKHEEKTFCIPSFNAVKILSDWIENAGIRPVLE